MTATALRARRLSGKRELLLAHYAEEAPVHVTLTRVHPVQDDWRATSWPLQRSDGTPSDLPCPVLTLAMSQDITQVGIVTKTSFLTGTAACALCRHQLSCAVDGQTRSFSAAAPEELATFHNSTCDI